MAEDGALVCIVGVGAVSALGPDARALESAIFDGQHGLAPVARFDTTPFAPVHLGGCVREGDDCVAWSVRAAREAWRDAGLSLENLDPRRVAVVAGTTEGEEGDIPGIARAVAEALGARGPRWTVSTACTSSANAIGLGRDLLLRGDADVVVAGGAERLLAEMYAGFHRLGVLATEPCAPFGDTRGTTLAEGAGFVVLTRRPRGAPGWAYLHGYGLASDAWHATTPEPRGLGIARAIRGALGDAGVPASQIDYVNAHGTGTAANDDAEWRGVETALGARAHAIPVSASKSFLGHGQGAAGALELIATLRCVARGALPPTLRVGAGRPGGPPDPVAAPRPRPTDARSWLSNSSAFGGANAVLCVGLDAVAAPSRPRRITRVVGLGVARFAQGAPRDEARLTELAAHDLKGTDPSTRFCIAAASRALSDAGVRVRGALRERAGVFGGASRVSPESMIEYRDSIERGGLARCSAAAFSRLVLHAPAGAVSRSLALRGPTTTLASEGIAGLLAFAYAADTLERRDDADLMLALGFDERGDDEEEEGAACLALSTTSPAGPCVSGVASAGPDAIDDAIDAALARAGTERDAVAAWCVRPRAVAAPSLASARLAQDAVMAVREGAAVAVVASAGGGASCAVVLTAQPREQIDG